MTNEMKLFSEWRAAIGGTWFTTRSHYPDVPCYISPVALRKVSNCSANMPYNSSVQDVEDYLINQVRILRFNNPKHIPFMIKAAISGRMMYWKGNRILQRDAYFLGKLLDKVIEQCFEENCADTIKHWDRTKYWYSDEIQEMSGVGSHGSVRFKAKHDARQSILTEGYRDDLEVASGEYRNNNFDVLPTIKILTENVVYTKNTVAKYGDDFYIHRVENIGQRVQKAREIYPKATQQEIADIIEESKRTVREYWRSK